MLSSKLTAYAVVSTGAGGTTAFVIIRKWSDQDIVSLTSSVEGLSLFSSAAGESDLVSAAVSALFSEASSSGFSESAFFGTSAPLAFASVEPLTPFAAAAGAGTASPFINLVHLSRRACERLLKLNSSSRGI